MPIQQFDVRRDGLRFAGGSVEPVVSADALVAALEQEDVEQFRPLLPVGYEAVARAYARAAQGITAADLTDHYTRGMEYFQDEFTPALKRRLAQLTGGCWDLDEFAAYAAGSDVDLITHLIEAVAAREPVHLFPGDWYGFLVGSTHPHSLRWESRAEGRMACLCVPSVRNGHFTDDMAAFIDGSAAGLLNLNLFPTLAANERHVVARRLAPFMPKLILSISFSRGFGMTASQLGVFLVHRDHPYRARFEQQWNWYTYFYNALAAKAFLEIDLAALATIDDARRAWVDRWLEDRALPVVPSGSYYVKAFRVDGPTPERLSPLDRDGLIRLCFKPPQI
jgi:hypothetical protein